MLLDETLKTLAANYSRLLQRRPHEGSRMSLAKKMGVGDGSLGRIMYASGNPSLETIVQVAQYFRVAPWQLIAPEPEAGQVREGPASYTVDEDALAQAIDWVTTALDEADLTIPKKKKARAIALVYSRLKAAQPIRKADVIELVRKVG